MDQNVSEPALKQLAEFAQAYVDEHLRVIRAVVTLEESPEREPITNILILLGDPKKDGWDVDHVRALRQALGRQATVVGLPPVALTLVAESERRDIKAFAK